AGAMLVFAVALTSWQLYANGSLREDLQYWERQMTTNRRLFDELSAANNRLQSQSVALNQAFELMVAPYQLSEFIMDLGRTIPATGPWSRPASPSPSCWPWRITFSGRSGPSSQKATPTRGATASSWCRRSPAAPGSTPTSPPCARRWPKSKATSSTSTAWR